MHFVNNATLAAPGTANYQKLGKIQPIIDAITKNSSQIYQPGKNVSVDEAMVKFKGRSTLKQYMPKKPIKRGSKIWMLADAMTGYVTQLEVYTGKKGDRTEKGLGATVVKTLSKDLQHTHRHVYFDNYFSRVDLLLDLFRLGLYGCGTLRSDRKGFPPSLKQPAKKGYKERGESETRQYGNLTISVWQDNRPVTVIATNADPLTPATVNRKKRMVPQHVSLVQYQ